jgi:Arc/MetJ-type ribon-helix-helix transcriptional regulator
MTKRRYTFWINHAEATALKQIKADEGISESEQVRQAIRDWLARKGYGPARSRVVREAGRRSAESIGVRKTRRPKTSA